MHLWRSCRALPCKQFGLHLSWNVVQGFQRLPPPARCPCRLPTPRPGQVLGLVGSNGTGERALLLLLLLP